MSAPTRVQQLSYRLECGQTSTDHIGQRCIASEYAILVGQLYPAIRQVLAIEDIQRLEDAHEIGNPTQSIFVE